MAEGDASEGLIYRRGRSRGRAYKVPEIMEKPLKKKRTHGRNPTKTAIFLNKADFRHLRISSPPAESAWKEAPHWLCIGRETC